MDMSGVTLTQHSVERYIERVRPCAWNEAEADLLSHERAILTAAAMGCRTVRLGNGARLVLDGATIVTVYPARKAVKNSFVPRALRRGWGRAE